MYAPDKDMGRKERMKSKFTFIDLFAGIGGMRLAFERAGGRCIFSSEWNKYAQQTYEANIGDVPAGDITEIPASKVPRNDILVGGFPCQPFSIAGVSKKRSLNMPDGFADETQGTLFFDIVRILKAKRPKAFLLENVKNLASHDKGQTFKIILKTLRRELNYDNLECVGKSHQSCALTRCQSSWILVSFLFDQNLGTILVVARTECSGDGFRF